MQRVSNIFHLCFCLAFLLLIGFPLAKTVFSDTNETTSAIENRALSPLPHMILETFPQWASMWDAWFKDHLAIREQFLQAYIIFWELYLRANKPIILIHEEEFFPTDWRIMDGHLGLNPLSLEELVALKQGIIGFKIWLSLHNIPYLLVFTPDKATCYSDKVPGWLKKNKGKSIYEQITETLRNTDLQYIDMGRVLISKKNIRSFNKYVDVYHWNGNALDASYKEIQYTLEKYGIASDKKCFINSYSIYTYRNIDHRTGKQEIVSAVKLNPLKNIRDDSDKLRFIADKLRFTHQISYQWAQPKYIKNSDINNGSIIFTSDSMLLACSGTFYPPFPHTVHEYVQAHYAFSKNLDDVEKLIRTVNKPDVYIESFVERTRGGTQGARAQNPRIRILADYTLKTPGYYLTPEHLMNASDWTLNTAPARADAKAVIWRGAAPEITLPELKSDMDGRVIVAASVSASHDSEIRLLYAEEGQDFSLSRQVKADIIKGENLIHLQVFCSPFQKVKLRVSFSSQEGEYTFFPLRDFDLLGQR